jgi:integrase
MDSHQRGSATSPERSGGVCDVFIYRHVVAANGRAGVCGSQKRQAGFLYCSMRAQCASFINHRSDAIAATRTWQHAVDQDIRTKDGMTQRRWRTAAKDRAFDSIRKVTILETQAEHFIRVLELGTVSTNFYLRRLHSFALDLKWLPLPVIPKRQWPKIRYKEKRAISLEEHQQILAHEPNPERRAFCELCWHLGGSQSDIASLLAEDIDWQESTLSYSRLKTGTPAIVHLGEATKRVLRSPPASGPLFPTLRLKREGHRATQFKRCCRRASIVGVTLHSYRDAWAERAKKNGYPERFAQQALGHNSRAVHRAYAKKAQVNVPSLEEYEKASEATKLLAVRFA